MRFLVVGYGSIGRRHSAILRDLGHEVVSVDPDPRAGADYRGVSGGVSSIGATELDWRAWHRFDGVLDCTPPDVRAGWSVLGKARFVEKPLGDCGTITKEGRMPREPVQVGFCYRWLFGLEAFVADLAEVRVFSITMVAGQDLRQWHEGEDYRTRYHGRPGAGGVVLDSISHSLYIARWIVGDYELVGSVVSKLSGLHLKTEDVCAVLLRSLTGVPVSILNDYLCAPRRSYIECVTSDGPRCWEFDIHSADEMYQRQMEIFIEVCTGVRRYGFPDLEDGLYVQKCLDRIRANADG